MVLSVEELQEFQKLKKKRENGEVTVESTFRFLELAIVVYFEQLQEDMDEEEEEAIFNGQSVIIKGGKQRMKRKNRGVKGTAKKRENKRRINKMKNRCYTRKQQKRVKQQRNREGVECGGARTRTNRKRKGKEKRSYKELKLMLKKKFFLEIRGKSCLENL